MATFEIISAANVIGGDGGGSSYLVASVELTDAQIKALPTFSSGYIELVPAPGANKVLLLAYAVLKWNITGGAYTNISADNTIVIAFGDFAGYASNLSTIPVDDVDRITILSQPSFVDGRGSWAGFLDAYVNGVEATNVINQPLKLASDNTGDFTGGNAANTLKVTVYYVVVDL